MAISGSDYCDITCVNSSGDLTSSQYYIVKSSGVDTTFSAGNLTCKLCTSSTMNGATAPKGVLQNDPDTGQAAIVRVRGLTKVMTGGAISVGDWISCSTAGTAVSGATTGKWCFGQAETASTASGQIIYARLFGLNIAYQTALTTA